MTQPSPQWTSNTIGATGTDDVRLVLNGQDVLIAEGWDIAEGVLEQPMSWSVRLGSGQTAAQIIALAPKCTPFQLYVAGALQATGLTEGITATGGGRTPTAVTVKGRDPLAELYVGHVVSPQSFVNCTYTMLVWRALAAVGLVTGSVPDPGQLATTNDANRVVKCGGKKITVLQPPRSVDEIISDEDSGESETATQYSEITARLGENWLEFVRRYLDPAGLTLWAAANGTFVLSTPNVNQSPAYQLTRQAGPNATQRYGNVVGYSFSDDATHRHSEFVAYGKGGGRKQGRQPALNEPLISADMFNAGWTDMGTPPRSRKISYRASSVQNTDQAQKFCQRKLMEEARQGYQLHYTVAGHTLPTYGGSGPTDQTVITPDTIVQVADQELGISGLFYIDSVHRQRKPETVTEIRLMRPSDVSLAYAPPGSQGSAGPDGSFVLDASASS